MLLDWKEEIGASELIFLRCSKSNYRTFMGYEGASIERSTSRSLPYLFYRLTVFQSAEDPRIRGLPFPTKRPTINELIRAFTELTRVKTSHLTPDALAQLDADYLASIKKPAAPRPPPAPKPAVAKITLPKLTKEEELERDRWERLVDMVQKGRVEATASFLDKYGPELEQAGVWGTLPEWMEENRVTPTLLHVASAADQPEMVKWLLVEKRANPTLEASIRPGTVGVGAEGGGGGGDSRPTVTPYELAPSRATRNVFRALTTTNPEWWDWTGSGPTGARVPSGLSEEKEQEREAKKTDRRGKLRDKLKEREKERDAKDAKEKEEEGRREEERRKSEEEELRRKGGSKIVPAGPQRLGGGPPRAIVNQQMGGLSELQRARLEREQRARAAEARLGGRS